MKGSCSSFYNACNQCIIVKTYFNFQCICYLSYYECVQLEFACKKHNFKKKKLLNCCMQSVRKFEIGSLLELPYAPMTNTTLGLLEWQWWWEKVIINSKTVIIEMIVNFRKLGTNNSLMIRINIFTWK